MAIAIDFDTLSKIGHLNARRGSDLDPFGSNTCCDYVDSLHIDGNRYGITVFVEPCGDITKWGASFSEVADWWIEVFRSQPADLGYCHAGWHLNELKKSGLPDDASKVWGND